MSYSRAGEDLFSPKAVHLALFVCLAVINLIIGGAEVRAQSAPNEAKEKSEQTLPQTPNSGAQDGAVERVDSNLAVLLMTAVNKNKQFVTTLQPSDLRVFEDGVPQQITVFERETARPLVLAILLDASGSQERSLPKQKEAVNLFLNTIFRPDKDEAMVISFAGTTLLQQSLTHDIAKIQRAVARIEVAALPPRASSDKDSDDDEEERTLEQRLRGTALYDSVFIATRFLAQQTPPTSRRALILLTDGEDTASRLSLNDAIKAAAYSNAAVYSIGIGDTHNYSIDKDVLKSLSEQTGGRAFFPKHESDLRAAFDQIEQELRSQYVIGYVPTNRAHDGQFRQVKIEIANPALAKEKLKLQYRKGYFAKNSIRVLQR